MLGRLHWIIYARSWMFLSAAIVALLGAGNVASSVRPEYTVSILALGVILLIVSFGSLLIAWIERFTTEIAVTDFRIILKTGLVRRSTIEINALRVESVDVKQSVVGRILGFGTVEVRGTGIGLEPLRRIADPIGLRRAVQAAHQSTLRGITAP